MTRKPSRFRHIRKLKSDLRGGTLVEFALLAPAFLGVLIGVVEVGAYMQNYNAVRNLAADAARFATVEYQKENELNKAALESNIKLMGTGSPYMLHENQLTVTVTPVAIPQVTGAKEFDLDIDYRLPNFSGLAITEFTIQYSRPLFVIDNSYSAATATPTPTPTTSPTP